MNCFKKLAEQKVSDFSIAMFLAHFLKEFVIDFQENVKIKPVLRISLEFDVMSVLMVNGVMIIVLIYVVKIVS